MIKSLFDKCIYRIYLYGENIRFSLRHMRYIVTTVIIFLLITFFQDIFSMREF